MKHFNLEAEGNIVMDDDSTFNKIDTDPTLAADSDDRLSTQKAIKEYVDSLIPSGKRIWFYEDAAPVGWTLSVALADGDNILAVKGLGGDTYNLGGSEQGGWSIFGLASANESSHRHTGPNHNHTMPSHNHTGPSHTHTGPSHTHLVSGNTEDDASSPRDEGGGSNTCARTEHSHAVSITSNAGGTGATGAGGTGVTSTKDPGDTNNGGTGNTGTGTAHKHTITSNSLWRPKGNVGIICSKD